MSLTAGKQLLLSSPAGGYQVSRSLRFNSADSAYLSRTPASAGSQTTWTFSCWLKRGKVRDTGEFTIFGTPLSNNFQAYFGSTLGAYGDTLQIGSDPSGYYRVSNAVFRDPSAWYHFVFTLDTNNAVANDRLKVWVNGVELTWQINNTISQGANLDWNSTRENNIGRRPDLYFDGYMADIWFLDGIATTPSAFAKTDATTGQWIPKTYTGSTSGTNTFHLEFADNSNNTATTLGKDTSGNGNNWTPNNFTVNVSNNNTLTSSSHSGFTQLDPYNNFVDGNDSTSYRVVATPSVTTTTASFTFGTTLSGTLEVLYANGNDQVTGRISIDGGSSFTALAVTGSPTWISVGTISGNNVQIRATFNYGGGSTASFYGIRVNGVNVVTAADFAGIDSLVDTPTSYGASTGIGGEQRGNYAVLNPLDKNPDAALANGNLDYTPGGSVWRPVRSTIGVTSGKWYWEILISNIGVLGIATQSTSLGNDYYPGIDATSYGYTYTGVKYNNGSSSAYGNSFTTGDLVGVAYDADTGKIWFSKNGTWQASGDPAAGTNAAYTGINTTLTYFPMLAFSGTGTSSFNAGQRAFAYTAPSGFKALVDTNLTAPVIAKPNTAVDVALWTGNNTSGRSITGLNFSPDFVWIKSRSNNGSHALFDVLRSTNMLASNDTGAESSFGTPPIGGYVSSFNSNGFTLTNGSTNNTYVNENTYTYVGWCWDAGSTTSTNNSGSIQSTVRVNTTAGFSIVTWNSDGTKTGTVGHGLNVKPKFVLAKTRNTSDYWVVYTDIIDGSYDSFLIPTANAKYNSGGTNFTTSVFNPYDTANTSGQTGVAYCWTSVTGYSSFGTYTGNLSTNGPFVYTGFRPAVVLIKSSSNVENWIILDNKRLGYNVDNQLLYPNLPNSESGADALDLLSNGFKIRLDDNVCNGSGYTYIWAAWAENPFAYARAR